MKVSPQTSRHKSNWGRIIVYDPPNMPLFYSFDETGKLLKPFRNSKRRNLRFLLDKINSNENQRQLADAASNNANSNETNILNSSAHPPLLSISSSCLNSNQQIELAPKLDSKQSTNIDDCDSTLDDSQKTHPQITSSSSNQNCQSNDFSRTNIISHEKSENQLPQQPSTRETNQLLEASMNILQPPFGQIMPQINQNFVQIPPPEVFNPEIHENQPMTSILFDFKGTKELIPSKIPSIGMLTNDLPLTKALYSSIESDSSYL